MIFLYQRYKPKEYILSNIPIRELQKEGFRGEILRQFQDLNVAEAYCLAKYPKYITKYHKKTLPRRKISETTRKRMRLAKLGKKNPNYGGISEEHRKNISKARYRLGIKRDLHWTWNVQRPASTKRKISKTMKKLPKRRRAIDENGKERLIWADQPLPENWVYGRKMVRRYINPAPGK